MSPLYPAVSAGLAAFASASLPAAGSAWPAGAGWCWVFTGPGRFARCARARRFARIASDSGARLMLAWVPCPSGSLLVLAVPGFLPAGAGWRVVA